MSDLKDKAGESNLFGGSGYSFVEDRFGTPNEAIYFRNGYLQIPAIYFGSDFTITACIKIHSYQYNSRIVEFSNGPHSDSIALAMYEKSSQLYLIENGKSWTSKSKIELDKWYHVTYTQQRNVGYMFVNGIQVLNENLSNAPKSDVRTQNFIGSNSWKEANGEAEVDATYDDIKIYDGAFTAEDAYNDYVKTRSV